MTSPPATDAPAEDDIIALADGSGCSPGDQVGLPDGEWFGLVEAATETTLTFDLACWFSGEAADLAAIADGEAEGASNDYHVWNRNTGTRDLSISPDTPVHWYIDGDASNDGEGSVAEWMAAKQSAADDFPELGMFQFGVWITVVDRTVTVIEEVWVP